MTDKEHDACLTALQKRTDQSLLDLAREFNVQDPAEDREALIEQLVPILAFDELMQTVCVHLDREGGCLVAVEGDNGQETFGWLVRVERENSCLILAPVERGAPETVRIVLDWDTRWRVCEPPTGRKVPELDLDF